MERLLGETTAVCTAVILAVIGIGLLAAGQLHKKGVPRRFRQTIFISAILLAGIGATVWWIVSHPDMQAIIVGSSSGEIVERLPHYDTGVALNVDLAIGSHRGAPFRPSTILSTRSSIQGGELPRLVAP
jgi:hypothetical protein